MATGNSNSMVSRDYPFTFSSRAFLSCSRPPPSSSLLVYPDTRGWSTRLSHTSSSPCRYLFFLLHRDRGCWNILPQVPTPNASFNGSATPQVQWNNQKIFGEPVSLQFHQSTSPGWSGFCELTVGSDPMDSEIQATTTVPNCRSASCGSNSPALRLGVRNLGTLRKQICQRSGLLLLNLDT